MARRRWFGPFKQQDVEQIIDARLSSLFQAALADPDAKKSVGSFISWMAERVNPKGGFGDEDK